MTANVSDQVKQTIGRALGRVPSGVFILTARHDGQVIAMMASWVQQAAFAPPSLCVAIAKDRPVSEFIRRSKHLALSVLGEHDSAFMKKFARPHPPGVDPFEGVNTLQTPAGLSVLADAVAWLEGRLVDVYDFGGDHDLFVAAVTGGAVLKPGASFMHLRGNGFHY